MNREPVTPSSCPLRKLHSPHRVDNFNAVHRELLSSPARRSSDVEEVDPLAQHVVGEDQGRAAELQHRGIVEQVPRCWSSRSEEPSELQSLRHLVCRLLLEKKKR